MTRLLSLRYSPVFSGTFSSVDISYWKVRVALLFILTSAAPALYIAPFLLAVIVLLALLELIAGRNPTAAAPVVAPLLVWLSYLLASGLASGVPLWNLLSYQAIRYDANVFYSTLPLLVLGSGALSLKTIDAWVSIASIAGTLGYLLMPLAGIYLFESHNAAGGYFMVLLAYLSGRVLSDGIRGRRLAIASVLLALQLSDSRGSIIAVVCAVSWSLLHRKRPRLTQSVLVVTVLLMLTGLAFAYHRWVENGSVFLYDYAEFGLATDQLSLDAFMFGERPGTILHRVFFLYPMALDMFLKSPWIGIGFTRFDDFPINIVGWPGLLAFNLSNEINHSDLHAHNSYLHLAAETGLIGLWLVWRVIRSIFRSLTITPQLRSVIGVLLVTLLIASLTEHRLTTPSQAAPIFTLVGLLWTCRNSHVHFLNGKSP